MLHASALNAEFDSNGLNFAAFSRSHPAEKQAFAEVTQYISNLIKNSGEFNAQASNFEMEERRQKMFRFAAVKFAASFGKTVVSQSTLAEEFKVSPEASRLAVDAFVSMGLAFDNKGRGKGRLLPTLEGLQFISVPPEHLVPLSAWSFTLKHFLTLQEHSAQKVFSLFAAQSRRALQWGPQAVQRIAQSLEQETNECKRSLSRLLTEGILKRSENATYQLTSSGLELCRALDAAGTLALCCNITPQPPALFFSEKKILEFIASSARAVSALTISELSGYTYGAVVRLATRLLRLGLIDLDAELEVYSISEDFPEMDQIISSLTAPSYTLGNLKAWVDSTVNIRAVLTYVERCEQAETKWKRSDLAQEIGSSVYNVQVLTTRLKHLGLLSTPRGTLRLTELAKQVLHCTEAMLEQPIALYYDWVKEDPYAMTILQSVVALNLAELHSTSEAIAKNSGINVFVVRERLMWLRDGGLIKPGVGGNTVSDLGLEYVSIHG